MSEFLRSWLVVVVFGGLAVLLVSAFLGLSSLLRPSRETPQKTITSASVSAAARLSWSESPRKSARS